MLPLFIVRPDPSARRREQWRPRIGNAHRDRLVQRCQCRFVAFDEPVVVEEATRLSSGQLPDDFGEVPLSSLR